MQWCLLPSQSNKFLVSLKNGVINPEKMAKMTSAERRELLTSIVGEENAKHINAAFEAKLLLKNQQAGMITWAKQVSGLKKEAKRDLISKIQRMEKVLTPKDEDAFLADLAEQRLGIGVSAEEAQTIATMAKDVETTRKAMEAGGDRMEYGRAKVKLGNYVSNLKLEANRSPLLKQVTQPVQTATTLAGHVKSIKSALDNSALFRQGLNTLFTHPGVWKRNSIKSFIDILQTVRGQEVMDEVHADIQSRPNFERMQKAKLAVGTIEEAFPSSLPERIPGLGRLFKASDVAYTAFLHRTRADVFDKYLQIAKKNGLNIDDPAIIKPIASMVNSLTGRANFGKYEGDAVNAVNNIFFSPRLLKSHIDTLGGHVITGAGGSAFVRKQAAISLLKIISSIAAILLIAKTIDEDSVDLDPRSSDFGKIRVGDTRFDVSGGKAGIVTLAARMLTQSTKSSTTDKIKQLNTGEFGSQTTKDVLYNFMENKLSPAVSVLKDIAEGQDFDGNAVTIQGALTDLLAPLPISNAYDTAKNPRSAPLLVAMIADGLGIGTNTYSANANWSNNPGVELQQFQEKVGKSEFKKANDSFNNQYNDWLGKMLTSDEYAALSDEQKQSLLEKKKDKLKQQIFDDHGFKYKKKDPVKVDQSLLN